jgi:hypothetical protein
LVCARLSRRAFPESLDRHGWRMVEHDTAKPLAPKTVSSTNLTNSFSNPAIPTLTGCLTGVAPLTLLESQLISLGYVRASIAEQTRASEDELAEHLPN